MGIVQLSCLGAKGRFGNQLFQYAFARMYAEKYGHSLQIPYHWVGRVLFPACRHDPLIDPNIKVRRIQDTDLVVPTGPQGLGDVELDGYFQSANLINQLSISKCREWFAIDPKIRQKCTPIEGFYVAAHLRRGDYLQHSNVFPVIKAESYRAAMKKFGYSEKGVVWVSDGDGKNRDLRFPSQYDFIADFVTLLEAPVLFRSNSTFGWWACALQENGKCYSPSFPNGSQGWIDCDFVEGNAPHFQGNRWSLILQP